MKCCLVEQGFKTGSCLTLVRSGRSPNLSEMLRAYHLAKEIGLNKLKLGNCGIFTRTNQDWEYLLKEVGKEGIG